MEEEIVLRPAGNKSRFGYRGKKKRYAVFKAECNQKWAPFEQTQFLSLCEENGVDSALFLRDSDNKNRKWSLVLFRLERFLGMYPHRPGAVIKQDGSYESLRVKNDG